MQGRMCRHERGICTVLRLVVVYDQDLAQLAAACVRVIVGPWMTEDRKVGSDEVHGSTDLL
jgi:hypothetical protein